MGPPLPDLSRYRLLRRLGRGGMAEVFLARAEGPGGFQKELVIKRILPQMAEQPEFVELFLNEARLAALLNHPNIVQLFELGRDASTYFIAMELVDGPNLRQLMKGAVSARRPLPATAAARIAALACEGLAYAHELVSGGVALGIVHRDVSPENILVSRSGSVKVVDFGIASAATASGVARQRHGHGHGHGHGKLHYMAPEQLRGELADRRADVFALGVVLFELLTGVLPFETSTTVAGTQLAHDRPADPVTRWRPDCPPALCAAVARALETRLERRHLDCRALQRELELFLMRSGELVGPRELAALVAMLAPKPEETVGAVTEPVPLPESAAACPRCRTPMALSQRAGVVVDGCPECGGLWLDSGELQQLANSPGALAQVAAAFRDAPSPGEAPVHDCPRCASRLRPHRFKSLPGLEINRCAICQGVWVEGARAAEIAALLAD